MEPRQGDIILAREAPVGEVGIVPPSVKVCLGQRTVLLRPDREMVQPHYLLYLLLSPSLRHSMQSRSEGSTVPHLNVRDIRDLLIPHPPSLGMQRSIVGSVRPLDDKIELNRRMNETLDTMAQAMFKSWFVDFDPVRAKMDSRRPALMDADSTHQVSGGLRDSRFGPIPAGWTAGTLGDVALSPRRTRSVDDLGPEDCYIGLEHVPRKSLAITEWADASRIQSAKSEFFKGDILFGRLRPYFHKVALAPVSGVCSTDILTIVPVKHEWRSFLLGHLFSDDLIQHADSSSTGTRMPRVSWTDLARYEIAIPPRWMAARFDELMEPLLQQMNTRTCEMRTLRELRDDLLPKLMSGEIRVSEAEEIVGEAVG